MSPITLPEPFVVDDELRLRPPTDADVPAIAAACQDEAIREYTRVPDPYRMEDALAFVRMSADARADGHGAHLLAVDRDDALLGACGLMIDTHDGVATVGYWIAPWARRRGIATRATRAMCRWAFAALGVARIGLTAAAGNAGSNGVARGLGFTLEGTLRDAARLGVSGRRDDMHVYGLLPGELT